MIQFNCKNRFRNGTLIGAGFFLALGALASSILQSGGVYETSNVKITGLKSTGLGRVNPATGLMPFIATAVQNGTIHAILKQQNGVIDAKSISAEIRRKDLTLVSALVSGGVQTIFTSVSTAGGVQKFTLSTLTMTYTAAKTSAQLVSPGTVTIHLTKTVGNAKGMMTGDHGTVELAKDAKGQMKLSSGDIVGHVQFDYTAMQAMKNRKLPQPFSLRGTANKLNLIKKTSGNYVLTLTGNVHILGSLGQSSGDSLTDVFVIHLSPKFEPLDMNSNNNSSSGTITFQSHGIGSKKH